MAAAGRERGSFPGWGGTSPHPAMCRLDPLHPSSATGTRCQAVAPRCHITHVLGDGEMSHPHDGDTSWALLSQVPPCPELLRGAGGPAVALTSANLPEPWPQPVRSGLPGAAAVSGGAVDPPCIPPHPSCTPPASVLHPSALGSTQGPRHPAQDAPTLPGRTPVGAGRPPKGGGNPRQASSPLSKAGQALVQPALQLGAPSFLFYPPLPPPRRGPALPWGRCRGKPPPPLPILLGPHGASRYGQQPPRPPGRKGGAW